MRRVAILVIAFCLLLCFFMPLGSAGEIGDIGAAIDRYEFENDTCANPRIIHISGDVYAIAYYHADDKEGWIKTVAMDSNGAITEPFIDSYNFSPHCHDPDIIHISGTTYALVHGRGTIGKGNITTVTIANDGEITEPAIDLFSNFTTSEGCGDPDIYKVFGDIYAVVCGNALLRTVEIAANGAITEPVIGSLEFATPYGITPTIAHVSGTTYAIAYRGYMCDGYVTTVSITADGANLSVIEQYEFETDDCRFPDILKIADNVFGIAYDNQNTDHGFIKTLSISDSGLSMSTIDTYDFVDIADFTHWIHINESVYAVPYRGVDIDGYLKTITVADNGQISEPSIDTYEFNTTNGWESRMIHLGNYNYAIAYESSGEGHLVTLDIAREPTYTPPNPTNIANTTGNFWVNHTWSQGSGNVTDSYNVSINSTWHNGTTNTHYNNTPLSAHAWSNITVWAYNSSGGGSLSTNSVSENVELNNPPTTPTLIAPADGNETTDTTPSFNWTTSTDADGDSITYTLQIDNESGFSSPYVYENTSITNSNLTLAAADALDDGLFYWRVRAYDSYDYGSWATYFNFTVDATTPVISNMNRTPSSVYEDEAVTITCSAVDAGVGMHSVWVMVKDSKSREANHTLTLISGSSYSLDYCFTGKTGTFYILYFYANDSLGNEVANSSSLSFFVKSKGGGPSPGSAPQPTPSITPFPEGCDDRCRACSYISGLCRLDGCRCNEVDIAKANCGENETCCCLKSLEPYSTATPLPEELSDTIERIINPFKLMYEYIQRVFFYTPFMPDEINQTKQFPWCKIANKQLVECVASAGDCYIQPDDNYSIFIAYTESREEMWASKEFINITVYDIDDYPAWAKMDILVINLAAYFDMPPEKWDVGDDAVWHYLFKFEMDVDEATWITGVRLWWLVLVALAVVIGAFGEEKVKKRRVR